MPAGTKHYEVAADIVETVGDQFFDDRGLAAAGERLGKPGRLFGRKEFRHLGNLLRHSEHVQELGQGQYQGKQGLVVLTDERFFFLEKSLGSETLEQFDLDAISSMAVGKKMTGETLQIFTAGHTAEVKSMGHGQADASNGTSAPCDTPATRPSQSLIVRSPLPAERVRSRRSLQRVGRLTFRVWDEPGPQDGPGRATDHMCSSRSRILNRTWIARRLVATGCYEVFWLLRGRFLLVGDTGFEPVTSSVSRKRATTAPIARRSCCAGVEQVCP